MQNFTFHQFSKSFRINEINYSENNCHIHQKMDSNYSDSQFSALIDCINSNFPGYFFKSSNKSQSFAHRLTLLRYLWNRDSKIRNLWHLSVSICYMFHCIGKICACLRVQLAFGNRINTWFNYFSLLLRQNRINLKFNAWKWDCSVPFLCLDFHRGCR